MNMMDRRVGWNKLSLGLLLATACGAETQGYDFDATGFDGVTSQKFALVAAVCTVNSTTGAMAITIGNDETGYLFRRATDNRVVANAIDASGAECTTTTTAKITVTGTTGDNKLLIDYA